MRTKKEFQTKEFNDDMTDLRKELGRNKIPYTFGRHEGAVADLILSTSEF